MALVRILAALLAACSLDCAAAPFGVQIGDTRIGLDAPPGFADSMFTGSPRLQELAESLTSASNRILLFALSDADLRRFTSGDTPDFRRYMLVVTPKGLERERIALPAFQRLVSDSMRDIGPPPESGDFTKHLEKQPPGVLALLAELRKDPGVVSMLQGSRIPPARPPGFFGGEEKPQYLLTSTTLMLIRGRALNLSVHTLYDSPADVNWIRLTTERWIEDLLRLNSAR